jgi:hypothetical protein
MLKNQDNFSVWAKMDPEMKKYYRGMGGNPGFVSGGESTELPHEFNAVVHEHGKDGGK